MRSFDTLIKEIEKNKVIANTDITKNIDPRTYTTKLGHVKRAKQNLEDLFLEYRKEAMKRAVFILAKGSQSKSFVDIAKSEYGCFSVGADEIYEEIISKVNERYYDDQTSSPALFDILMSSFNDICDEVGIIGYPAVLFESKYKRRLKNKKDLLKLTKEAFNDKVGSELVGIYAVDKASQEAVNEGYNGKTIPIIITSKDNSLMKELSSGLKKLNSNVFEVNITKKQNQKLVEEKLLKIKEQIK